MTNLFLIASVTILLLSCSDIQKHSDKKEFVPEWDMVRIKVNGQEFLIPFNEDTTIFVTETQDSLTKNGRPKKTFVSKKMLIPRDEKDSILKLTIDAITKPVLKGQDVSCYGGQYVTLSIEYAMGTKLSCKYSSVSDWTSISPTLRQISKMTFEKYGH